MKTAPSSPLTSAHRELPKLLLAWLLMGPCVPAAVLAADHAEDPRATLPQTAAHPARSTTMPAPTTGAAEFGDLPDTALVRLALTRHPMVKAASANVSVAEANQDRLNAGPHEFSLRVEGQRRRDVPLDTTYMEQTIGLERAIRMPGKSAIDADLGKAGVNQAENALGDAYHEAARLLLRRWFDWQRGQLALHEWQAQVAILQRQLEVAKKRVTLGDAAHLEKLQAEAQLAQALAQQAQANTAAQMATTEFTQQFPALPLPAKTNLVTPQKLDTAAARTTRTEELATDWQPSPKWMEKILTHNHELSTATAATRQQQLIAKRVDAERLPDPTIGVRAARERDGQERLFGMQISIPLPGAARAAASRAEFANVNVAAAREAQIRAKVEAEAQRTLIEAEASFKQWEQLAAVSSRMTETAELLDKAWRLGEGQFSDLQFARRQAIDACLAAVRAQADANEARYRVLLDAHELWAMDEHADEVGVEQKNQGAH
jgi:outer membrane protein TolC